MKTYRIKGNTGESILLIGEGIGNIQKYVPTDRGIIVTDGNVEKLYRQKFPPWPVIRIGTGESAKTLDTVKSIYGALLDLEADRSSFIVGIGGGIVCDVAGFAASTYLRGLRFGFVATTLLAQVDASVGGKNGVNFEGYKNIVGVFNQPGFVICDISLLSTLPEKEILSGMGEIVKHAAIADIGLFEYLEENTKNIRSLDPGAIEKLVHDSIVIKSAVVNQDERESGARRVLNFGHTFGHAFEKVTGRSHGEAVSAGMMAAASISVKRGMLSNTELNRLETLLHRLHLPTTFPVDRRQVLDALKRDKKRERDIVHFVLLNGLGRAVIETLSFKDLEKAYT